MSTALLDRTPTTRQAAAPDPIPSPALSPIAGSWRRWLALVVLCIGQLMIVLDVTVVNVALPEMQRDLHFSQTSLAWVINGYLISFGGLLMLAGRLGDIVGRRRLFVGGLVVFTAASVLCGIADAQALLIAARFLQGAGAAVIASMVLGILVPLFESPRERAMAMSVYAFVASTGGAIGLLVGGALTQALSWHWIFFINLPIGLAAAVLTPVLIPRQAGIGLQGRLDIAGAVLITAAPALLVYSILQAADSGWATARTAGLGGTALALLAAFVWLESRIGDPLVPLRVFRSRTVVAASLVRALFAVGLFGVFFLGALYLQRVLGYGAVTTGLAFLPMNLSVALFSLVLTRRVVARFGARATVTAGLLLVAIGLALFARVPVHGAYLTDVLPAFVPMGVGAGLIFMPTVNLAMAGAGPRDAGVLSGLTNVSLQIGAAIGVAVLASVSTSRTNVLLHDGVATTVAMTSGYRAGLLIAMGSLVAATVTAALLLRPASPRMGVAELAGRLARLPLGWRSRGTVAPEWD